MSRAEFPSAPRPLAPSRSQDRRGRSSIELSHGDALRRETTHRLMKLKAEHDEYRQATFKPQLNTEKLKNAKSKLRISSDPDNYLERLQVGGVNACEQDKCVWAGPCARTRRERERL